MRTSRAIRGQPLHERTLGLGSGHSSHLPKGLERLRCRTPRLCFWFASSVFIWRRLNVRKKPADRALLDCQGNTPLHYAFTMHVSTAESRFWNVCFSSRRTQACGTIVVGRRRN